MRRSLSRVAVPVGMLVLGIAIGLTWNHWSQRVLPSAVAGETKADPKPECGKKPQRIGAVIGVKPEKLDEYVKLHAATWPGVLKRIRDSNIRNYSIYLGKLNDGKLYLFAYYDYIGDDYDADMKKIGEDPTIHDWWKLTDPCQIPQQERKAGEHWMTMKEVFHTD